MQIGRKNIRYYGIVLFELNEANFSFIITNSSHLTALGRFSATYTPIVARSHIRQPALIQRVIVDFQAISVL